MDEFQKKMLEFMKEAKEKQKEEDERRKKEEARSMEERKQVAARLDGLVGEIAETVKEGIKKEIKDAVEPIRERQDKVEKETEASNAKIDKLVDELKEMRDEMKKMNEKKSNTWGEVTRNSWQERETIETQPAQPPNKAAPELEDEEAKVKKIIREAKKVVGMRPIAKVHVQHTMRRNEEADKNKDMEERWKKAMTETVEAFLKYQMKMAEDDIDQLKIVKIFPPAKDEWDILYVEFESKEMVNFLMSFTKYMRRDENEKKPSILKYIPKELFTRYSAVESAAFQIIRKQSNFKAATNVSFGDTDFVLKTRSKDIHSGGTKTPWTQLEPVPLPKYFSKFELNPASRTFRSPALAPGRPPLSPEKSDKRKERGTPESPTSPSTTVQKRKKIHPRGSNVMSPPAIGTRTLSNESEISH